MRDDFLIIGGGAVGLNTALTLLQAGYQVSIVERGEIGKEASWAGGGILSPLCSWDYQTSVTQLTQRSMAMFQAATADLFAHTGIDTEYIRSGMLVLPPMATDHAVQWCEQHKVPVRSIALSEYFDALSGEGLLLPDIAQVRNPRLLRALRIRVEQLGGKILEQHDVQRIEFSGDRVIAVHTSHGELNADAYIVTAGSWSNTLMDDQSLAMDIHPIRGQILLLKFQTPPMQHIVVTEGLYLIPRRDGHVLIGSTLEDVGFDKSTTHSASETLFEHACQLYPAWRKQPIIEHWAGLRPGSRDNIPTIGRHAELSNLYANTGHFRYGVTMSFASAEILLNEIEGKVQPFDVSAYRWI
ncbi:MAG: glycine oxidase ThiO [Gallionella sp.]|nr:glycine oxidase ThiO [Gallionella sp.]